MQVLYQLDLAGPADQQTLIENLEDEPGAPQAKVEAVGLALAAWDAHSAADEQISVLTPDWPTHRQPPVDRAILRLAYYEIVSNHAPQRVAINEAVELAKEFAGEHSPSFINGVLDKLAKRLAPGSAPGSSLPGSSESESAVPPAPAVAAPKPDAKPASDAWLKDAVDDA